jgi:essential nuclear protein 1
MGKKRERHQNPEPFLPEDTDSIASSTKTRSKVSKHHQKQQKVVLALFFMPFLSSF